MGKNRLYEILNQSINDYCVEEILAFQEEQRLRGKEELSEERKKAMEDSKKVIAYLLKKREMEMQMKL